MWKDRAHNQLDLLNALDGVERSLGIGNPRGLVVAVAASLHSRFDRDAGNVGGRE